MIEIKRRERDAVLQSLQAGLVPRLGLHLIQVGRKQEVAALLADLDRVEQGGAAFRVVVGRFGSGKSFFLNLVRNLGLQKRMVVVQADMSMERRLHASGGEARALYSELVRNLAIKSKPDKAHPLFREFVSHALDYQKENFPKSASAPVKEKAEELVTKEEEHE